MKLPPLSDLLTPSSQSPPLNDRGGSIVAQQARLYHLPHMHHIKVLLHRLVGGEVLDLHITPLLLLPLWHLKAPMRRGLYTKCSIAQSSLPSFSFVAGFAWHAPSDKKWVAQTMRNWERETVAVKTHYEPCLSRLWRSNPHQYE